ncbi:hypothetical protein IFR05_017377, partial [Cadophora sp. M221]
MAKTRAAKRGIKLTLQLKQNEKRPFRRKSKTRRTKSGCTTCRQRRVKCDEKKPCTQCIKSKRECSYTRKLKLVIEQPPGSTELWSMPEHPPYPQQFKWVIERPYWSTERCSSTACPTPSLSSEEDSPLVDPPGFHDSGYSKNGDNNDALLLDAFPVANEMYKLVKGVQRGRLHMAPIQGNPQRIICIGDGFGEHANNMGMQYPSARVYVIEKLPLEWREGNVFVCDDNVEEAWSLEDNSTNFIHVGCLMQSFTNHSHVFKEAFRVLKPGGYLEVVELHNVQYKNGEVLKNDYFDYVKELRLALGQEGRDFDAVLRVKPNLHQVGFNNIEDEVVSMPIGAWPEEGFLSDIGEEFRTRAISSIRPLRWPTRQHLDFNAVELCRAARDCLSSADRTYFHLHTVIARKLL